jgi:hypothetical protein
VSSYATFANTKMPAARRASPGFIQKSAAVASTQATVAVNRKRFLRPE